MISQKLLKEWFEYNDGALYWKIDRGAARKGDKAGGLQNKGYWRIGLYKNEYGAHRLIFLFHYGWLPIEVDHIDKNPLNNSIENLRAATSSQNKCNVRLRSDNTSGSKGVTWVKNRKKWRVRICIESKEKCIGYFSDFELADLVAQEARNKYHKGFASHG